MGAVSPLADHPARSGVAFTDPVQLLSEADTESALSQFRLSVLVGTGQHLALIDYP